MNSVPRIRGTQADPHARIRRQVPLSGRRGALPGNVSGHPESRPVDTIADARRLAGEAAG